MLDNAKIGNHILFLRKRNGFTQDELAEKLGITALTTTERVIETRPYHEEFVCGSDVYAIDIGARPATWGNL